MAYRHIVRLFIYLILGWMPVVAQLNSDSTAVDIDAKMRGGNHLYLKLSGGFTVYGGDTDQNPENNLKQYLEDKGLAGRLELGKTVSEKADIGLALTYGTYPEIEPQEIRSTNDDAFENTKRFRAELLLRYHLLGRNKIDPFLQAGANLTSGHIYKRKLTGKTAEYTSSRKLGYGPTFGGGLAVQLSKTVAIQVESSQNMVFPDLAADGANYEMQLNSSGDQTNYDWLGYYGAGLTLNLGGKTASCQAPKIKAADYSGSTNLGETLSFSALVDGEAEVLWAFGDGMMAVGQGAMHQFANAGMYEVTVTATNACGTDQTVVPVQVLYNQECTDIEIVAVSASKFTAQVNENVQFYASVSGSNEAKYQWNFGDGTQAETRTATHSFSQPGMYQVQFTAMNQCEAEQKNIEIEVKSAVINSVSESCAQITQLNAVYFDYGSTTLDARAKAKLDENIDLLKTCPSARVKVLGYKDHVEQNEQVSMMRAQSIQSYYQRNGIEIAQLSLEDKGTSPINCDKEDPGIGCRRNRRADSVPLLY